jgi:hypothetical protein
MAGEIEKVRKIKNKYEKIWLSSKGVVAVGIGRVSNKIGIIISVDQSINPENVHIPSDVEGIPVKIQSSGSLRAL